MIIRVINGGDRDFIEVHRVDGAVLHSSFPKKGPFPHDIVHWVVERELGFDSAFWGRVFSGATPAEVGAIAKAGGHHSAARSELPDRSIVQLLQAERLVECFEAELWGEPAPLSTLRQVLAAACAQSRIDAPDLNDVTIDNIRDSLATLQTQWQTLAIGGSLKFDWP